MIGAIIFVIFFLLFLVITIAIPTLPIGQMIQDWLNIPFTDYPILGIPTWVLINAILNGVIYGFIIWLVFTIVKKIVWRPKEKPQEVAVTQIPKEPEVSIPEPATEVVETTASSNIPIIKIEGIGRVHREKLAAEGIKTTGDLLEAGKTRKGREDLAERAGLSPVLILEWVNLADLVRIKGVSEEYSDLLEEAGVDTVVDLARRNPENLHQKIIEVNTEKKLVRRPPTLKNVEDWIEQAKNLPCVVEY